jgi:hypothetical protein
MPADITRIDDSKTAYIAGTAVLGVASIACAFLFPPIAVVSFWGAFGAGAVSGLCAGGAVCTGVKAIGLSNSVWCFASNIYMRRVPREEQESRDREGYPGGCR